MRDLHRHTSGSAPFMAQAVGAFAQLCEAEHTRVQAPAADAQPGSGERAQDAWPRRPRCSPPSASPIPPRTPGGGRPKRTSPAAPDRPRAPTRCSRPTRWRPTSAPTRSAPSWSGWPPWARISVEVPPAPPAAAGPPTPDRRRPAAAAALRTLTSRERDVLVQVAAGRTNREIAEQLFISPKTVSVHVSHILEKLGVRTRVQAGAVVHELERGGGDAPMTDPLLDGSVATIDEVLARLDALQAHLVATRPRGAKDGVASFNYLYRTITADVLDGDEVAGLRRRGVHPQPRCPRSPTATSTRSAGTPPCPAPRRRSGRRSIDAPRRGPHRADALRDGRRERAHQLRPRRSLLTTCETMQVELDVGRHHDAYQQVNDIFAENMEQLRRYYESWWQRAVDRVVLPRRQLGR